LLPRAKIVLTKFFTDIAGLFPKTKFFMFNPGFDEYSYKFSYDSEGNVKDVSLSKAEYAPDDFDGMDDIKPI
jgi:hypothetical protein